MYTDRYNNNDGHTAKQEWVMSNSETLIDMYKQYVIDRNEEGAERHNISNFFHFSDNMYEFGQDVVATWHDPSDTSRFGLN
tara:strand:- start:76 stop:318 length:243 start_codon:yes stop_codon:yes gene_type:complete